MIWDPVPERLAATKGAGDDLAGRLGDVGRQEIRDRLHHFVGPLGVRVVARALDDPQSSVRDPAAS